MKFNPGETYRNVGGARYIKDSPKKQVDPVIKPKPEPLKEEPKVKETTKVEKDESVQHTQVVQKPKIKRTATKRKQSSSSSSSD